MLRRLDYSETSQVMAVFTRDHGQQRVIAKGVKRSTKSRTAVGLDLLEKGAIVLSTRHDGADRLSVMMEWRQEDTFPHLRRDLVACYVAQYAAEATSQLTEVADPHPALFDALLELLEGLAHGAPLPHLDAFLWALLTEIGLRPELERCMSCGNDVAGDAALYFSSREGGAICRDCEPSMIEKRKISPAAAKALNERTLDDPRTAAAAFDLLDYHLTETVGRPLRLSGPLIQCLKAEKRV